MAAQELQTLLASIDDPSQFDMRKLRDEELALRQEYDLVREAIMQEAGQVRDAILMPLGQMPY